MPEGIAGLAVQLVVLAVLVLVLRVMQSHGRTVRLVCPQGKGVVECTLVGSRQGGVYEGVERCSAFGDAPVRCNRACLALVNEPR